MGLVTVNVSRADHGRNLCVERFREVVVIVDIRGRHKRLCQKLVNLSTRTAPQAKALRHGCHWPGQLGCKYVTDFSGPRTGQSCELQPESNAKARAKEVSGCGLCSFGCLLPEAFARGSAGLHNTRHNTCFHKELSAEVKDCDGKPGMLCCADSPKLLQWPLQAEVAMTAVEPTWTHAWPHPI